jgi:hypothetical protein
VRGLFKEMRIAWGLPSLKPVQVLGDNMFLIEFDSEEVKQRVVGGGPWRHKGDALLVVPYDGLSPPSTVVMNIVRLWARLYDLPAALRKDDYVQKLGARLGQVQRVDLSFPSYVRVRVLFRLANALVLEVKIRIKGKRDMSIPVRYENVSFFCFICGRIGHSDKECPNGELGDESFNFRVELRASPPKWLWEIKVQALPAAARFLNFEGPQLARLQEEATSSTRSVNARVLVGQGQPDEVQEEEGVGTSTIPHEDERVLMKGVQDIEVTAGALEKGLLLIYGSDGVQQRVSLGTNMGSKGETSVGDVPQQFGDVSPTRYAVLSKRKGKKVAGLSKISSDKAKRKRLSPYARPEKYLEMGNVPSTEAVGEKANSMTANIKCEDEVMVDEGFGAATLTLFLPKPHTLTVSLAGTAVV